MSASRMDENQRLKPEPWLQYHQLNQFVCSDLLIRPLRADKQTSVLAQTSFRLCGYVAVVQEQGGARGGGTGGGAGKGEGGAAGGGPGRAGGGGGGGGGGCSKWQ